MNIHRLYLSLLTVLAMQAPFAAHAHEVHEHQQVISSPLQVTGTMPPLTTGVSDLKFKDMFKMPVGPLGMEPTEKLLSLNNKQVRIIGYMAQQESATPGLFILSPLPVHMGDEDDKFADDMPANSIFVHLDNPESSISYIPGLIHLTGVLSVGNAHEPDGRISYVRIKLDPVSSSSLLPSHQASK